VPSVSLPTELVYEILLIAATSDRSTLSTCVLLSKSINHLLQPILYRSVAITNSGSLQYFASLACELKSDSPLRHVRNLWLGLRPGLLVQFLDLTLHPNERVNTWWRNELIHRVLRGCNLRRLDLDAELRARPRLKLSCAGESLDEFHFHFPASGQTLVNLDTLPKHTKKLHLLVSGDPTLPLDLEFMSLNITHLDVMMTVTYTVSRILPIVRRLPQLSVLLLRLSRLDNVAIIKRRLDELIQYGQTTQSLFRRTRMVHIRIRIKLYGMRLVMGDENHKVTCSGSWQRCLMMPSGWGGFAAFLSDFVLDVGPLAREDGGYDAVEQAEVREQLLLMPVTIYLQYLKGLELQSCQ